MSHISTLTESYLIEQCIKGNRQCQKEMYDRFASKMFAICLRYAKNQMDAEDILQEAFIKVFNNLHKFRCEGSFDGWIRRIFVNTAIECLRRRNDYSTSDGSENYLPDTNKNGLQNLYEKDVLRSVNTLSNGYRKVFTMYAVDGYSHKEIASQLGITESTSKSQFSRAKVALRDMLATQR